MNIYCIHCGKKFSITKQQLGKRGKCPHCKSTVIMPRSKLQYGSKERQLTPPSRAMENSFSGISAIAIHLLALVALALIPWGNFATGEGGEGDQIMIGQLSKQQLVETPNEQLQSIEVENPVDTTNSEFLENDLVSPDAINPLSDMQLNIGSISGGARKAIEIQSFNQMSVLASGSEAFGKMINRLKKDGLDIVIVFDSTGSMQGEIDQVKTKIGRIGNALQRLIPEMTRIGICTYRDNGDQYVVKGLPLTAEIGLVTTYLETINASGGGDRPEAVDEGLAWAIQKNNFRRSARKVILLFGDAPPRESKILICEKLASDFRNKYRGVVSTVTCRSEQCLPSFESIAQLGGGESFLTSNEREIMKQLMVLVFGSQHRSKVLEAFNLMNE
ncbi:MAG: VWA domain-containing protein [Planctomycetota bacterium]